MAKYASLSETLYIRLSEDDKSWIQERAKTLKLRPTIYARVLLSKAIEIDKREPGKLLC
jgi:hypothetical protein